MPWWGHWHLRRGGALDAGCCLVQGSLLMSRAGLPPPGTHSKARACPSSQDDSERGHLCWMNLKGTVDATCFSPLSSKSEQCLSSTSMPGLQEAASSLWKFASLLFIPQRAFLFYLFCFALLHCLVPTSVSYFPHYCPHPDRYGTTDPAPTLHRPCTRHCAKRPHLPCC